MNRATRLKTINHLIVALAIIFNVAVVSVGLLTLRAMKINQCKTHIGLYKEASRYHPEMANWVAERVYLKELKLEEGNEALKHLIKFFKIMTK